MRLKKRVTYNTEQPRQPVRVLYMHLGVSVDIARNVRVNFREIIRESLKWIKNLRTPF